MPLVRIDHAAGKGTAYRDALSAGVHAALLATFDVPEDDRFQVVAEHPAGTIVRPASYLGVTDLDDLVLVRITCNEGRSIEKKKALHAATADNLVANPGMRREDVVVILTEVKKENCSFDDGIATYAS